MAGSLAIVKRALTRLSAEHLIERARAHLAALAGNPRFPIPVPALAVIEVATDALEHAEAEFLNNGGRRDRLARNERKRDLYRLLVLLASYVQVTSGGDPEAIASAGFPLRRKPQPAGPLPAPGNLRASAIALIGVVKLHWGRVRHRSGYEVQTRVADPQLLDDWRPLTALGANYYSATGLQSGVVHCFRVRAIGAAGPGPWSDIAMEKPR
ncbi:MAG: fibronectin type III domain-containing protein [Flavobacteriales bacterium]|nr:fibronectin type III domain-containing protein [Flavobacteriales bacterium]